MAMSAEKLVEHFSGSPALLVQLRTWRTWVTVWPDTCFWYLRVTSVVSHASSEGPVKRPFVLNENPAFTALLLHQKCGRASPQGEAQVRRPPHPTGLRIIVSS